MFQGPTSEMLQTTVTPLRLTATDGRWLGNRYGKATDNSSSVIRWASYGDVWTSTDPPNTVAVIPRITLAGAAPQSDFRSGS